MEPNNKGSALLTALFIMTLVAIVATAMSARLQIDIYRTRILLAHDKLYLASQAVLFWSFNELNNEQNQFTKANKEGQVAKFPDEFSKLYPGVLISGALYDLQSKINLNNFTTKKSLSLFTNLLQEVFPKSTEAEQMSIAAAIQDWISNYDISKGNDSYTSYYLSQKPAYLPSHQIIKSPSELRLLKNISASIDQALQPYITALPEVTPININTAPPEVLMALGDGLNESQIEELLSKRGANGIKNIQKITPLLQKFNIASNQITTQSIYFLSKAYVTTADLDLLVYVVIKREQSPKGKIKLSVVRESLNTL